jgi:lipoprotein Spr
MFFFDRTKLILKWVGMLGLVGLLLTGCKSSRTATNRGSNGRIVPGREYHFGGKPGGKQDSSGEDYSKGISDPVAKALIAEAQSWIGTRYQYGGMSKDGTDCSGFMMSVYDRACGVKIPRTTRDQVKYCTKIARNNMLPGDLIFFAPGNAEEKVGHVGLYIGDGRMIHASSSRGVIVSHFNTGYWADRYFISGRVDAAGAWRKASPSKPTSPSASASQNPSSQPASASPEVSTPSLDLLDELINQKIDSIFSSQSFE